MGADEIMTGGCGDTPCSGGRRRRSVKKTKKHAGRRHRKVAKRGGFVGDALVALW